MTSIKIKIPGAILTIGQVTITADDAGSVSVPDFMASEIIAAGGAVVDGSAPADPLAAITTAETGELQLYLMARGMMPSQPMPTMRRDGSLLVTPPPSRHDLCALAQKIWTANHSGEQ